MSLKLFPLNIKSYAYYVPVLYDVIFALEMEFPRFFGLLLAAQFREIGEFCDFGADKSLLQVGMYGAGGFGSGRTALDRPLPDLILTDGKK